MTKESLRVETRRLLLGNVREGYSGLLGQHYCFIAPALKTYPFQWFWDTCFHVIILSRLCEFDIAKRNLRSLCAIQEDNGFVGHMIFWKQLLPQRRTDVIQARPTWQALRPHMSALIQPPLAATALLCLFESCEDRVFLGELYARIRRYHEWLARSRDFDGDGLLTIISPFESGMDWKASYDPVLGCPQRRTHRWPYFSPLFWKVIGVDWSNFLRGYDLARIKKRAKFCVKDAGFNAIYAADLHAMEKLAGLIGDDATIFAKRRKRVAESIVAQMYDEREAAFFDVKGPGSDKIRVRTASIFFPLAIEEIDQRIAERVLEAHFEREDGFAAPLPLPSLERRDPAFYPGESAFIWRGPTWAFINWFLYHALKKRGFHERAARLREALAQAIERSGFREYYNPFTGEGHGARNFTWSGLLLDMRI